MKMKRSLLTGLILMFGLRMVAQVNMTAQVPPEGVLQKAQLWNILLVSVSNNPVNVKIILRLSDLHTGQPLLTGISNTITLNKGARQLQAGNVSPVQYEYSSDAIDRSANGLLSAGNYQAFYSLLVEGGIKAAVEAEDCIPFTVSPVAPPQLNTPADHSIVETYNPQFTWLPPTPVTIFNNLNYELLLTEVRPGQSAGDAIQQNLPVYRVNYTKSLFVNYPASAIALDTAKLYAWTIMAKNGSVFAAQTDVWTFRIKNNLEKDDEAENTYVLLKKELDGSVAAISNNIRCVYTNMVNDSTVTYELLGLEAGNSVLNTGIVKLQPGENMLELELKKKYHLQDGKSYLFRLKNSRNEYWQVKFIYAKAD
jgi:hypothetical protein